MKKLHWVGSSKKDYIKMPEEAQDEFGHALHLAQMGDTYYKSKPLKGFGSSGVVELKESYEGGAYRVIYTVIFEDGVYVIHCFKKKSTSGIATPKPDMDIIRSRLNEIKRERNIK